ncbi:MAG: hypothetical protein U1A78_14605 [Polyangia bacterium]
MWDQDALAEHAGLGMGGAHSPWAHGAAGGDSAGAEGGAHSPLAGLTSPEGGAGGAGGEAASVMSHWADGGPETGAQGGGDGAQATTEQVSAELAGGAAGEHALQEPEPSHEAAHPTHQGDPQGGHEGAHEAGHEAAPEPGHEAAPDAGHEAAPKASAARSRSSRVHSGLGRAFDKYAQKSPTLRRNIKKLQQTGWHIKYGKKGGGSYCDKGQKVIVVDRAEKKSPMAVMQTMAHETGHALYVADPYVGPEGLSKKQYVAANVRRQLRDEGEATIMNMQIRRELLKRTHGHMDIGVAGRQANRYKRLFERYRSRLGNPKVRDKLRTRIGNIFADHEHPSTAPSKTYRQNYSEFWSDTYDKNVNNAPSSDPNQAPDPELDEGHGHDHGGPAEPAHSH